MKSIEPDTHFIEIGFDSLLLTQVALNCKKEFGLPISFRQLNESFTSLDLLAGYLDELLPEERFSEEPETEVFRQSFCHTIFIHANRDARKTGC